MTLEKDISLDETNDNNQQEDVTDFEQIVDKMLSRRGFIGGATALGTSAFLMSTGLLNPKRASAASRLLEFEPIAANTLDTSAARGCVDIITAETPRSSHKRRTPTMFSTFANFSAFSAPRVCERWSTPKNEL